MGNDQPLTPSARLEQARNQLGMAQLKIIHANRNGALAPDAVELVSQRIGYAQEQLNRLPDYPAQQPSEAEAFFRGCPLDVAVSLVVDALDDVLDVGEDSRTPQVTKDRVVQQLAEHVSDAELERLLAPAKPVSQAGLPRTPFHQRRAGGESC